MRGRHLRFCWPVRLHCVSYGHHVGGGRCAHVRRCMHHLRCGLRGRRHRKRDGGGRRMLCLPNKFLLCRWRFRLHGLPDTELDEPSRRCRRRRIFRLLLRPRLLLGHGLGILQSLWLHLCAFCFSCFHIRLRMQGGLCVRGGRHSRRTNVHAVRCWQVQLGRDFSGLLRLPGRLLLDERRRNDRRLCGVPGGLHHGEPGHRGRRLAPFRGLQRVRARLLRHPVGRNFPDWLHCIAVWLSCRDMECDWQGHGRRRSRLHSVQHGLHHGERGHHGHRFGPFHGVHQVRGRLLWRAGGDNLSDRLLALPGGQVRFIPRPAELH